MGLVTVVGLIANSSAVRAALTYALSLSATGALVGGVWAYWRQQQMTGWLRGALGLIVSWFVVVLARPRLSWPSRDSVVKQLQEELRAHLRHVTDLTLAWCWAHPQRQPQKGETGEKAGPEPLPSSVCRSLGDLYVRMSAKDGATDGLQDAVEVLLQRFEDVGYEWKLVAAGAPFDETMNKDFESFARIEPGQPVRTRRPALLLDDRLIQKGELQRE